jgi:hypothetical protein
MLNTTTLSCNEAEEECCDIVDTDFGPRLLCEFDTLSHCVDCWAREPLFWGNNTAEIGADTNGSRFLQVDEEQPEVVTWEEGLGCLVLVDYIAN